MIITTLEQKASRLVAKMYMLRSYECRDLTVNDIINKATEEEINFYYYWFFFANNWRCFYV